MTPTLLTLSRQLAALPGFPAPWWIAANLVPRDNPYPDGGIQWRQDPDNLRAWIPDLSDPSGATGGVLLNLIPPLARWRLTIEDDGSITAHVGAGIREVSFDVNVDTLAEACARVLVALGRANG